MSDSQFDNLLYFADDRVSASPKKKARSEGRYHSHFAGVFKFSFFIEAFLIHSLHYLVGPLVIVFCILGPVSYFNLLCNMEFYSPTASNLVAHLVWITNVINILVYIFFDYRIFDYGLAICAVTAVGFRCIILAAKYATFTPELRLRMMTKRISH